MMKYTTLGKSGLQVSRIGFGCMSLTGDDVTREKLLHKAVDMGINYFDTADFYEKGANEITVGKAFKKNRNKIIIATKVGNQWRPDGSGWDWNPRKGYILSAVNISLKRLQTEYIDLYQLHGGTIEDPIDETIEAFEMLQQQGKIRHYGISSIRPNVIREYVKRSAMVSVMMQYSLLDRRPEETCLSLLQQNQVGLVVRGSVAKGLLVDKAAAPYLNYSGNDVSAAAKAIKAVSGSARSAAQTAMQFVLNNPAVTAAVVGIRTTQQLDDAVKAMDAPGLTDEEMKLLRNSIPVNVYDQHR